MQTNGFGTALKVLFEFGNGHAGQEKPLLRRTELVALINTLDKISSALKAIEHFRDMVVAEMDGKDPAAAENVAKASPLENYDDLEQLDDFDDFAYPELEKEPRHQQTISEAFWQEFDTVFRAYKWVLQSWFELPKKTGSILAWEVHRLYSFWLGKPVAPRSWQFKIPNKDEL